MTEHPATYDCDGCNKPIVGGNGGRNDMIVVGPQQRPAHDPRVRLGAGGPTTSLRQPYHFHDMACLHSWTTQWNERSAGGTKEPLVVDPRVLREVLGKH